MRTSVLVSFIALSVSWVQAQDTIVQQALYSYENTTVYIRLSNNDFVSLSFNDKFTNDSQVTDILASPPSNGSLVIANNQLYAFYETEKEDIGLQKYDSDEDIWYSLSLSNESVPFYQYSNYLTTLDDDDIIFIYGGISPSNSSDITSRLLAFDVTTLTFQNFSTSVTPTNFYGASNLLVNYETQIIVGGQSTYGWVSLEQLALWQYETWSFKTMTASNTTINSRRFSSLLPIFNTKDANYLVENSQESSFAINSVMMVGGEVIDELATPNFVKLNMSSTSSSWNWESMDSYVPSNLNLSEILGSCIIYDTLITITNSSSDSSSTKKKRSDSNYKINLFDVSADMESISSVDYKQKNSHKTLVITLSTVLTIVPILLISAGICYYIFVYKKKKHISSDADNFDIMEFYNTLSQKPSMSSHGRGGGGAAGIGRHNKFNSLGESDNLSIESWSRKREEYENNIAHMQKKKRPLAELPNLPTTTTAATAAAAAPSASAASRTASNQVRTSMRIDTSSAPATPQQPHTPSFIRRSLSSTFSTIQNSIRRNSTFMSTPFSIREEDTTSSNGNERFSCLSEKSRSTLHLIYENGSIVDGNRKEMINDSRSVLTTSTYFEPEPTHLHDRFTDLTHSQPREVNDEIEDDDEIEDIDVQILVSSKRRSKLRVMNPDLQENESDENNQASAQSSAKKADDEDYYDYPELQEHRQYMEQLFENIDKDDTEQEPPTRRNTANTTRKRVVSRDTGNNRTNYKDQIE
ncbi:hypothetical protein PACTADRAFT_77229 [Pachysolen tannophilus NRRL Y-2460]|uniref:Galactose oxidase n=1 Tax=Pachysolen tannophilus NRRL Y-2460 TaxID=669874 RepID=A0A1E4TPN2_PACTA|nr:hypothetical protein PACTADRAFT_77229 [Pachysolen tannophilus NRRL Y-2460]